MSETTTSFFKCTRVVAIFFLVVLVQLATMAPHHSSVEGSRGLRMESHMLLLLESRLPRGLVPPSGPSLCHHKLGPYQLHRQTTSAALHTDDYIICP
ncbi:unnamed protein product [Linum trigynum]|uniref:Uncharacterized protein n=1 Tax=Linum trigynum TaxID=586398 RepID=A0AAV2GWH7_9ROSI